MFSVPAEVKGNAETLFLPLYFRALETLRSAPLFKDPLSVELVSKIDYDFSRLNHFDLLCSVVALRVRQFDRCVQAFVKENPRATIVNLGCGLDTRFHRLDNGLLHWYEVDLPEVIDFRLAFFDQTKRCRYIAGSVLDADPLMAIAPVNADGLLFLAEGLFPYFPESRLRCLVADLGRRFPGAMLIFDTVSTLQALFSQFHPAFRISGAHVQWGLDRAKSLEEWESGLRVLWQIYYFSQSLPRPGWYNLLQLLYHVRCGFSMVGVRFGSS